MGYKDEDVEIEITLVNPNKVDTVAYLSFHSSYLLPTNEVLLKTGQHDSISIPLDKFVVNESCKSIKGIRIGSDLPILVYGSSRSTIRSSTDFFLSIPQKALGKVYSVITGLNRAQLLVVGLHSNTSVNITVQSRYNASYQNTIYQSGQTIEETLNEYETLLVENAGKYPFTDFSGTRIRSSAQVSVFSGNGFSGSSIQVEQLPTVALWGTYHIALPPDENTIYNMTIVAVCNDTHISIECSNHPEMTYTLQTGNFLRFPPSAAVCFILTSEPVEIAIEIDGGGMDATMTILQPMRRIHLGYFVFHLPAFRIDMQYTLVVTAYCNTSLRLDDATLPLFKVATTDGHSSVCTGIQAIDNGTHAISSSDSAAFFISGYLYGRERHQTEAMPLVPYLDGVSVNHVNL
ncbi:uncharacterized protein [Argopecten irradians]|uniref:uncharacterized protein n=1 Tax=Argopecten irradians TaxID=31199 RepID=UPI003718E6A4